MLRYLKIVISITLISIIFITSLGLEINSHYCNMSKERDITLTLFNVFDNDATFVKESKSNCCKNEEVTNKPHQHSYNLQDDFCCTSLAQNYIVDLKISFNHKKQFKYNFNVNEKFTKEFLTVEQYDKFKKKAENLKASVLIPIKAIQYIVKIYSNSNKDKDPDSNL